MTNIKEYQFIQKLIKIHGNDPSLLQLEQDVTTLIWTELLPFTYSICKKIHHGSPTEVINSCFVFLKTALDKYDTNSNMKFTSYYAWIIKRDLTVELSKSNTIYIPSRLNQLVYRYKRDKPISIDTWLTNILNSPSYSGFNFENTKKSIIKYSEVVYVSSDDILLNKIKQDSFEDTLVESLSTPTDIFSDMEKVIGRVYSEIIINHKVNGLNFQQITDMNSVTRAVIHVKFKRAMIKLMECEWFCDKYKNWQF